MNTTKMKTKKKQQQQQHHYESKICNGYERNKKTRKQQENIGISTFLLDGGNRVWRNSGDKFQKN